jgi:hypothetical protein
MKLNSKDYQYFLLDELYILEERKSETILEKNNISEEFQFSKQYIYLEGNIIAYDYFFGLVPTLALEYGIPPYIQSFRKNFDSLQKYHHNKTEQELIYSYSEYVFKIVSSCKLQQQIAIEKEENYRKGKNNIMTSLWGGIRGGYYGILLSMYNQALTTFQIPIKDFISEADIESDEPLIYVDF